MTKVVILNDRVEYKNGIEGVILINDYIKYGYYKGYLNLCWIILLLDKNKFIFG